MNEFSVEALKNKAIIKRDEPVAKKTTSGFMLQASSEPPQTGIVMSIGPGVEGDPTVVKSGQHVLFGKYAGDEVVIDGEKLLIMTEDDILAIL